MKCAYLDCSQGASAQLMLGALTAASAGAQPAGAPVTYHLPGGAQVRCSHDAAGSAAGWRVICEFPEGTPPEAALRRAEFEELARAAAGGGRALELLMHFGGKAYAALDDSRLPPREGFAARGMTRRRAAVLAALALRIASDGVERIYYSKVNIGDFRGSGEFAPAALDVAFKRGVRTFMTPGAGELLTLDGAAVLAVMGECAQPALRRADSGLGLDGGQRMYALVGETAAADAQPEADSQSEAATRSEAGAQPEADTLPASSAQPEARGDVAGAQAAAQPDEPAARAERVALIECNIDDMPPEQLAYVCQLIMERGALDVWQTPIVMKKGRMAAQLSVLCALDAQERMAGEVLRHTSTLGVRIAHYERRVLPRSMRTVDTQYGSVRVKLAPGKAAPEYEDCRKAAQRSGAPIASVYAAALEALGGAGSRA